MKMAVMVPTYNPSTQAAETGVLQCQSQLGQPRQFVGSLG